MESIEKIAGNLARGKAVPAIVLRGSDPYLRDLCRAKIIEAAVPDGARDWAVARISARESGWDEILQRAQMLPMLAPRQVIFVEDADSIERLGDESRDRIIEALSGYFASPAPFTVLVIEAESLDGRQKFAKLLAEEAVVVELTIGAESAAALASQMARELGVEIDRDAAALLAESLNGEPGRMRIELEKLASFVLGRGRIAVSDVEELVVAARKNTAWQFAEMIAGCKRDAALKFLDNLLREGEQPIGLIGALAWMYRQLIEVREMPAGANAYQIAGKLRITPRAAEDVLRTVRRIPKGQLLAGLAALADADSALKSSNPDPRAAMEFLVAQLTSPAPMAASSRP